MLPYSAKLQTLCHSFCLLWSIGVAELLLDTSSVGACQTVHLCSQLARRTHSAVQAIHAAPCKQYMTASFAGANQAVKESDDK